MYSKAVKYVQRLKKSVQNETRFKYNSVRRKGDAKKEITLLCKRPQNRASLTLNRVLGPIYTKQKLKFP